MSPKRMDTIGWYIATMHQMLGHSATAMFLGERVSDGEERHCVLCRYEQGKATKAEVIERLGV